MSKPIIGIYAASMGDSAFGVAKSYLTYLDQFGDVRILLPHQLYEPSIDVLILQGGADISPSSYGIIPGYYTSNTDVFKQHVYESCLPNYINEGKKVFGICLGFQQICAYYDSVITQDLPCHVRSPQSERSKEVHDLNLSYNFEEFWTDKSKVRVNSLHHQGVLRNHLSDELLAIGWTENEQYHKSAKTMEIIEAVIHKDLPIAGVQWHPEEMYSPFANALLNHIINKM